MEAREESDIDQRTVAGLQREGKGGGVSQTKCTEQGADGMGPGGRF